MKYFILHIISKRAILRTLKREDYLTKCIDMKLFTKKTTVVKKELFIAIKESNLKSVKGGFVEWGVYA